MPQGEAWHPDQFTDRCPIYTLATINPKDCEDMTPETVVYKLGQMEWSASEPVSADALSEYLAANCFLKFTKVRTRSYRGLIQA